MHSSGDMGLKFAPRPHSHKEKMQTFTPWEQNLMLQLIAQCCHLSSLFLCSVSLFRFVISSALYFCPTASNACLPANGLVNEEIAVSSLHLSSGDTHQGPEAVISEPSHCSFHRKSTRNLITWLTLKWSWGCFTNYCFPSVRGCGPTWKPR